MMILPILTTLLFHAAVTQTFPPSQTNLLVKFQLYSEQSLTKFGGIPFCVDLNQDGDAEILWLQSPGIFYSHFFDKMFTGRSYNYGRKHFCLTATDAEGNVFWQLGEPWKDKQPFVTHCAERSLDCADIDADGDVEVVCIQGDELLVLDAVRGTVEQSLKLPADNAQIVVLGHTGRGDCDWTILFKNTESSYKSHPYANPVWFYDARLKLLKTADYWGAGHVPQAVDIDDDGREEFLIGYNLVDHDLQLLWTLRVPPAERDGLGSMDHVDDIAVGSFDGLTCIVYAGSDMTYLVDARDGKLLWKQACVHPQDCQVGRFLRGENARQVFIRNKRSYNQLFAWSGKELWRVEPPDNFPLGRSTACRKAFHVFDPSVLLPDAGTEKTDLVIYTDGGWPYVIGAAGVRCGEFPHTPNIVQDWGKVPGRPDDYGYSYYVRVADFNGDGRPEVMINDWRFAWFYNIE